MADQIRVNIKHRVNNASIKREKRNGRDVVVVPSAVAKFNTVLNDIFYGEQPLRESYEQINNLPAPLGHPVINGQYVSARMPEAINQFWSGAWNANARIEGDRVMADKIIDVEYAQNSENGRRLMQAIDQGEPISTSTGLLMEREPAPEGADYKWVGTNFAFDHDAILLDEAPAISTEDGVGMMVNAAGEQVAVVNSELELNDALPGSMEDMRKALREAVEAKYGSGFVDDFNSESLIFFQMDDEKGDTSYKIGYSVLDGQIQISDERQEVQRKTTWESVTNTIRNTLSKMFGTSPSTPKEAAGLQTNSQTSHEEIEMTNEEIQAMLDKQAESITANLTQAFNARLDEKIEPINETISAMNEDRTAAAAAEKAQLEETVVNAKLATEEEAKALDVNALKIMARNAAPGKKTAGIASGMAANGVDDPMGGYKLPEGDE